MRFTLTLLAIWLLTATPCMAKKPFLLFEWIERIENMPELGLPHANLLLVYNFFDRVDGKWSVEINEAKTRHAAHADLSRTPPLAIVDIEHLPCNSNNDREAIAALQKIGHVVDLLHQEKPELRVGVYSAMPIRNWWAPVQYRTSLWHVENDGNAQWKAKHSKFKAAYDAWVRRNERAITAGLAEKVDLICPSLYTFYKQPKSSKAWRWYAEENIRQARRYGKPVIVFLWPRYHDSGDNPGHWIEEEFFFEQLETAYELADGAVVWNFKTPRADIPPVWNEDWGWVKALRRFCAKHEYN